jgi:hypothetical protein
MKSNTRIKTELLEGLHAALAEQRENDLKNALIAWADAPKTDRGVLFGRNSLYFDGRKTFYVILIESGKSELVRGNTRIDSCAQALQVVEARKVRTG